MLITLSEAARIEGAPLQPSLARMTKNKVLPGFLKKTGDGWRVDTEDPAWGNLLAARRGQSQAANAVKREGARVAGRAKGKAAEGKPKEEDDDTDGEAAAEAANVQKAIDAKIIYNSRREKLKMMQDEIKINKMKGAFVERAEGEYWLSFIQREITDSFSAVDRCFTEVKRLVLEGNDLAGKQYLKKELKRGFEQAAQNMNEAVKEAQDD